MNALHTYWFGRKRFGWGFGPRTWEGWVATLVYVALMVASKILVKGDHALHIVSLTGLTVVFLVVFFWKLDTSK